ncbi:MAG: FAD-dependent tricarballylate dehydrogenase TcuA [Actinomycetota bacterium]
MAAYDVVVAGGGNAALCAAIAARSRGASVLVLECAPKAWRGGNSKYTRNIRVAHLDGDAVMPGAYSPQEFLSDLVRVTGKDLDQDLASYVVERSLDLPAWMSDQGIRWQPPLRGTLQLARTNRFFLGGGKALMNAYYRRAESLGIAVRYEAPVVELAFEGERCTGVVVAANGSSERVRAGAVVVATGGFEANIEWLREYWGDRVENYAVRGTAYNDGALLRVLLDLGAEARGNPRGHHAIAVDARSPKFEGGIVTRVDSVPFSIVVNIHGDRFADEGEDLWPMRYATWGGLIGAQPEQMAYSIFDSKVAGNFIGGAYPPLIANTVGELAQKAGLPVLRVEETVGEFNRSIVPGEYDPTRLDGCRTIDLSPPKSNWALPIDTPPYYCYPLIPGITFTYLAVAVDRAARVLRESGRPLENVYAAGEIMAGNILLRGYLAGIGMTIGTVFGVVAGEHAAGVRRG